MIVLWKFTYFGIVRIGASFRMSPTAFNSECTSPPANCHLKLRFCPNKICTFLEWKKASRILTNNRFASADIVITEIHSMLVLYIDSCPHYPQKVHRSIYQWDMVVVVVKLIGKPLTIAVASDLIHCTFPINCTRVRFSPKHFLYSPNWVFYAWIGLNSTMATAGYRIRARLLSYQGSKYHPKCYL